MTEQPKKRWQFSVGRLLGVITLICITLAVPRSLASAGYGGLAVVSMFIGFGSTVGAIMGGKDGAVLGAIAGLIVSAVFFVR